MRNVLLVINSVLTRNDNSFWNFRLGQISRTVFWGAEGLGKGCVKITLIVSHLELLTCPFLFIMVEFEIVLYSPDLKMILIFLVMTFFQKGTMFDQRGLHTTHDYLYKHGYNRYFLQREYYELTISHGQKHLRPGNLSGFLVKAKLRNLIQHSQPRGSYPCGKNCLTCKYISDGQTSYTFHSTGETRTQHIDCNFKNVIYMVQCNHCSKQYI